MNKTNIKKMINNYINDVIEGYAIQVSDKDDKDGNADIIIKSLKKLQNKLKNKVNQTELSNRISELILNKNTRTTPRKNRSKRSRSSKKKSRIKKSKSRSKKKCKSDEILNEVSYRCVKKSGIVGKKIMKKMKK
jgi:hypothetical protein